MIMALSLFSSDSDSDLDMLSQLSDWDKPEKIVRRARSKRKIRRENYMLTLNDADFTFRFRLPKSAVSSLLIEIMPYVRVTMTRNYGVSPLHQLLLTLRYYALGTMLKSVADFVGVSKSTAGRIVKDISRAITKLYDKYIFVHQQGAEQFYQIAGFPRVLAAVDCTHIRIQSPSQAISEEFRNNKGYFSLNVQAACDAELKLLNVVAHWPGSTHDATIFNKSTLKDQCDLGKLGNRWFLGDSAYPNRSYLLTPVLSPSTASELKYNEAHAKTRNTIKRTFEVWRQRFPVVAFSFRLSLVTVQAIITATAVLHNICRIENMEEIDAEVELPVEDTSDSALTNIYSEDDTERTRLIEGFFEMVDQI